MLQPDYAAPNALGERVPTLTTWRPVYAEVSTIKAREVDTAKTFAQAVTHVIRIRYLAGVEPTMRVAFGSRQFAINGIIDVDERHVELRLFCTETK